LQATVHPDSTVQIAVGDNTHQRCTSPLRETTHSTGFHGAI
jgi:hypothetical protein